jgi:hypothetical protein
MIDSIARLIELTNNNYGFLAIAIAVFGGIWAFVKKPDKHGKDKVRLRVIPKVGHKVGSYLYVDRILPFSEEGTPPNQYLCIEVVNLSTFPVTVSEVGISGNIKKGNRGIIALPIFHDGGAWPRRIEPHQAFTAYTAPNIDIDPNLAKQGKAYAITDCGVVQYGTSPAFREHLQRILSKTAP